MRKIILFCSFTVLLAACTNGYSNKNNHSANGNNLNAIQTDLPSYYQESQNNSEVLNAASATSNNIIWFNGMPLPLNPTGTPLNQNQATPITSLSIVESQLYATTTDAAYNINLTINTKPAIWHELLPLKPASSVVTDKGRLYVVAKVDKSSNYYNVMVSNNGGQQWHPLIAHGFPGCDKSKFSDWKSLAIDGNHVYVASCDNIITNVYDGNTGWWWETTSAKAFPAQVVALYLNPSNRVLYSADANSNIYKAPISNPEELQQTMLATLPSKICSGSLSNLFSERDGGPNTHFLFTCTSSGITWIPQDTPENPPYVIPVAANTPQVVSMATIDEDGDTFAATEHQVFMFSYSKQKWDIPLQYPAPPDIINDSSVQITSMTTSNNVLYIGTSAGNVWMSRVNKKYQTPWINVTSTYPIVDTGESVIVLKHNQLEESSDIAVTMANIIKYSTIYALTKNGDDGYRLFTTQPYQMYSNSAAWSEVGHNVNKLASQLQESEQITQISAADSFVYLLTSDNIIYYYDTSATSPAWKTCGVPFAVAGIQALLNGRFTLGHPYIAAYPKENVGQAYTTNSIYTNYGCASPPHWLGIGPYQDPISNISTSNKKLYVATYNSTDDSKELWNTAFPAVNNNVTRVWDGRVIDENKQITGPLIYLSVLGCQYRSSTLTPDINNMGDGTHWQPEPGTNEALIEVLLGKDTRNPQQYITYVHGYAFNANGNLDPTLLHLSIPNSFMYEGLAYSVNIRTGIDRIATNLAQTTGHDRYNRVLVHTATTIIHGEVVHDEFMFPLTHNVADQHWIPLEIVPPQPPEASPEVTDSAISCISGGQQFIF